MAQLTYLSIYSVESCRNLLVRIACSKSMLSIVESRGICTIEGSRSLIDSNIDICILSNLLCHTASSNVSTKLTEVGVIDFCAKEVFVQTT